MRCFPMRVFLAALFMVAAVHLCAAALTIDATATATDGRLLVTNATYQSKLTLQNIGNTTVVFSDSSFGQLKITGGIAAGGSVTVANSSLEVLDPTSPRAAVGITDYNVVYDGPVVFDNCTIRATSTGTSTVHGVLFEVTKGGSLSLVDTNVTTVGSGSGSVMGVVVGTISGMSFAAGRTRVDVTTTNLNSKAYGIVYTDVTDSSNCTVIDSSVSVASKKYAYAVFTENHLHGYFSLQRSELTAGSGTTVGWDQTLLRIDTLRQGTTFLVSRVTGTTTGSKDAQAVHVLNADGATVTVEHSAFAVAATQSSLYLATLTTITHGVIAVTNVSFDVLSASTVTSCNGLAATTLTSTAVAFTDVRVDLGPTCATGSGAIGAQALTSSM